MSASSSLARLNELFDLQILFRGDLNAAGQQEYHFGVVWCAEQEMEPGSGEMRGGFVYAPFLIGDLLDSKKFDEIYGDAQQYLIDAQTTAEALHGVVMAVGPGVDEENRNLPELRVSSTGGEWVAGEEEYFTTPTWLLVRDQPASEYHKTMEDAARFLESNPSAVFAIFEVE
jgi:hypothetical protein